MCTVKTGIKFCTCKDLEGDVNQPKPGTKVDACRWYLTRFKGENDIGVMGSIVGPSHDFGQGLDADTVLKTLNAGNAFDFEYVPEAKDSLRLIRSVSKGDYAYMSFIYDGTQWEEGMNPPFTSETEEIGNGGIYRQPGSA